MENYILHITSGRGPAECCLAVALTLKEIIREAEENRLHFDVIERIPGIENRTLLSATIALQGKNANQFCREWEGVILWISQSPFRKFHKRKNWFIGIQSFNNSEFKKWNENEVQFQTMRATGPGGQNVNKVESAVRAIHKSSGLSIVVNESRSQLQNKKIAMHRLKILFEKWNMEQAMQKQKLIWDQHNQLDRGNPSRTYEGPDFKRK